jgi:hypothetical protein
MNPLNHRDPSPTIQKKNFSLNRQSMMISEIHKTKNTFSENSMDFRRG